jgi:lipopolysaccharide export system protein LptA
VIRNVCFALALFSATPAAAQDSPAPAVSSVRHTASGNSPGLFGSRKCNGPIDVASDNFVGNFETKVGTYVGNVVVTRDQCKLRADKVVAEQAGANSINRLTASGNVVFVSTSGSATGDTAVYDLERKLLTLSGKKVVLVKGKDVMRGSLLVVDTNSGVAHLTAKGLPGDRVHTSFTPKQATGQSPESGDNGRN